MTSNVLVLHLASRRLASRRLASRRLALTASALGLLFAVGGCTTTGVEDLPDVVILLDGGDDDGGMDAGFPDPVVDTCVDPGGTLGTTCSEDAECDDGCYCNGVEACTGGECVVGTDPCENEVGPDGAPLDIACTDEACLEETNACFHMPNHAMCSDGLACNGYEQCDRRMGCVAAPPLYCNDESSCTVDSCDDSVGCVFTPRDLDGDGFVAGTPCGGEDCDDDPRYGTEIHPGAVEVCDNRRDDDCDGRRDFNDSGDCIPTNNTCDSATILPARSGTYSGSTATLTSNYPLACASGSMLDAVFRLHLDEPHDVRVSVNVSGAAIALRDFAQCATGPERKCAGTSPASVVARSLPAGDYAIIVRTPSGTPFDLQMMITDPTIAPAVDQCNAGTVAITASGTYTGRFEETSDDYTLTCHTGSSSRDAVYRLELAAASDVELSASTTGSGTQAYLALTTDCSTAGATLACATSGGGTTSFRRRGVPAGTYYVMIEPSDPSSVEWSLNVTITTPPAPRQVGDACGTAVPIPLAGTGTLTGMATAMLTGAEGDGGTGCGGATSGFRDVYFTFTLPETRDVSVTSSSSSASTHYVSLQTTCGTTGSELRCRSSTAAHTQLFRSLPAGTYAIAVATAATTGTITAALESRPPTPIPANDRCAGATALTDGADPAYETLAGYEDDAMGAVGSGNPDAFYTFTLAARRRVTLIAASLTTPGPATYLTLRSSCTATTNLASATGSTGSALLVTTLDPGTYVVFVEQPAASAGGYSIEYRTAPPPP